MSIATLTDRRHDLTRGLILDTAVDLLAAGGLAEVTVRAVARKAGMSERTVFRYFATRDEFLDAVAATARTRMQLPPPPSSIAELETYPVVLYAAFEGQHKLVVAGLHSEVFDRIREGAARSRWAAIRKLVDDHAPRRPAKDRKLASAQINYYLGASTWNFYRAYFGFNLDEAIEAAKQAIAQALASLR